MSKKRKIQENDEATPVKKKRTSKRLQFSNQDASGSRNSTGIIPSPDSEEGEAGIIEKVVLKNFMCHLHLECAFGPHVNFIIGKNGTGKSAILYGVLLALGGKPRSTGKNTNLASFIHDDKQCAEISVTLKNTGPDAYQIEKYGERIIIERRIPRDSSSTYKIKGDRGKLVSTTYEELNNILEALNIQVDNPVSILTQDASKCFLDTKDPKKKYAFFYKGTQLERVHDSYKDAESRNKDAHATLKTKKGSLPAVEAEVHKVKQLVDRYENLDRQDEKVKELEDELCWTYARKMQEVQNKAQKERDACKAKLEKNEKSLETKIDELSKCKDKLRIGNHEKDKEIAAKETIRKDLFATSNEWNKQKAKIKDQKTYIEAMKRQDQTVTCEIESIETFLRETKEKCQQNTEDAIRKQQLQILDLNRRGDEIANNKKELNIKIDLERKEQQKIIAELTGLTEKKAELDRGLRIMEDQLRNMQYSISINNKLGNYGQEMQQLVNMIKEKQHLFERKPLGPIGLFVTVTDNRWLKTVEACICHLLRSFCCDNMRDRKVLYAIMKEVFKNKTPPSIIVSKFLNKVHNVGPNRVVGYSTVFGVIRCDEPVIMNCLIDQCSIESIALIESCSEAANIMLNHVPTNCRRAYTLNGDEVHPRPNYRYYSSTYKPYKYLLENSRFTQRDIDLKAEELKSRKQELQGLETKLRYFASNRQASQRIEREYLNKVAPLIEEHWTIEKTRKELEKIIEEPPDITRYEIELKDILEFRKKLEAEIEILDNELSEMYGLLDSLKQDDVMKREKVKEKDKCIDDLLSKIQKIAIDEIKLKKKCECLSNDISEETQKLTICESNLRKATADATKAVNDASTHCQQVPSTRTTNEIESELKTLKNTVNELKGTQEDRDNIRKSFIEKKKKLKDMKKEISTAERMIMKLNTMIEERLQKYLEIRAWSTLSIQVMFQTHLKVRGYNGKLNFDHDHGVLNMMANAQNPSGELSKTGALSGGEKSFITIALLLSLYDVTEMPFHMLDEYDVFMDLLNRDISMEFMMQMAKTKSKVQFIFFSPLELPSTVPSDGVRILQMNDIMRAHQG